MDKQKALEIYQQIIEQSMGEGLFKKISDIQLAMLSLETLKIEINKKIEEPNPNP